jgi:biopolymer transport protein ExbD
MKISRRTMKGEIPATAMGDIAFNLMIFFVILAKPEEHLQWQPAEASHLVPSGQAAVSIVIDRDNKLFMNGNELGVSDLAGRVERQLGRRPPGDRTVLLKIHKDTLAQRFEPVIEAVSQAGGELLHVVEEKKP